MWRNLWQKWTIDKPAALGDWLWNVFVAPLFAFLSGLTWRRVVALAPLVFVIVAYAYRIPVPPELALLGDLLAYIDVFSILILLGLLSRMTTIVFVLKQMASHVLRLIGRLQVAIRRLDSRHRREGGARRWVRPNSRPRNDDDDHAAVGGLVFA